MDKGVREVAIRRENGVNAQMRYGQGFRSLYMLKEAFYERLGHI